MRQISSFFMDILEVVVFAIAIFLFIYLLILQPHKIKGQSMDPNFSNGEYLLTEKISYRLHDPQRGDVIVFKAPGTENEEFIKRVIGLPGETIEITAGRVNINGNTLNESYLPPTLVTNGGSFLKEGVKITIPFDHYFVMGDNRNASSDSRTWGLIKKADITGKAWIVYWPISKIGTIKAVSYSL